MNCECGHIHLAPCPFTCYWDDLLAKQMCPKHQVPVAECPIDLTDAKFQETERWLGLYGSGKKIPPDKPTEGGTFDVNHYSVYCQTCDHPSLWHWKKQEEKKDNIVLLMEGCRGFGCKCRHNIPGDPVPTMCDLCKHPIRWHDKAGPRCTALNCPCGRTAA